MAEFRLQGRISSSRPNIVFRAEFRLRGRIRRQGRISSSRPNFVFRAEFRLRGRISSSGPNFVFAAEFRLQGRISSSGPNFVFAAEFRLRGRISSSGPIFVFRAEFRLQGRISSSPCPKPNFVFMGISSSWPIFVFKFRLRAQFELQLLGNTFVFKSFGISASGGVRNRDPLSRTFPGQRLYCAGKLVLLHFRQRLEFRDYFSSLIGVWCWHLMLKGTSRV